MTDRDNNYRYSPLDRETFEAIAANAVGRGSEVNTLPAYHLSHSEGLSGWSVGLMQWDFGQPGRQERATDLVDSYQRWAQRDRRFTLEEAQSIATRLQTRGQRGNALTDDEQSRLNHFLRSDVGREFVNGLDRDQLAYKWQNVGQPLAEIPWLRNLSENDPTQVAEIVAMAAKRFNQGETRGLELVHHLRDNPTTSAELAQWIDTVSARPPANRGALITGRDNALAAVRVVNALEQGDGRLARAWREQIHENDNVTLTREFNQNPDVQLLDAMMRNPGAASRIIAYIDNGHPPQSVVITGSHEGRDEVSRVELTRDGQLTITSPRGDEFQMTREGWNRNGVPMQGRQQGRAVDDPDHTEGLRARPLSPDNERHPDHAMLNQIREGVRKMDEYVGKRYDEGSERLSHALLARAKENGMTSVDQVVIGTDRRNMFAVAGDPRSIANFQRTHVPILEAIKTPIEQSDEKLAAVNNEIQRQQEQVRVAEMTRGPDDPGRAGSTMRV